MEDETLSPAPELETPASPPPADTPDETVDLQATESGPEVEDDGLDDLEWEGQKYRVPRTMKPQLTDQLGNMSKHFTKSSQAHAEKTRELEQRAQRLAEQAKVSDEEMQLRVQAHHVGSQLEAYEKYTPQQWQELKHTDHNSWVEHRMHLQALRDAKRDLDGKISEADSRRTRDATTEQSKRNEEAEAYAVSKLKGWNAKSAEEIVKFAVELGGANHKMEPTKVLSELQKSMSPFMLEALYLARIGAETLKKQAAPPATPAVAPLEVVTAKRSAPNRVDLMKAGMDDYVRARQAQLKAKG